MDYFWILQKHSRSGLLLDLTEAFSVLNHSIWFDKLDPYGITGNMKLWFKSYLLSVTVCCNDQMEHRNFTQYRHIFSFRKMVSKGSILGPLFLLYINAIPLSILGLKLVLFADDTNILIVDKNEHALQQKILHVMKELDMVSNK